MDAVQRIMEGGERQGRARAQSVGGAKGDKRKGKGRQGETAVVDDYNARAIRHSLRVFVATGALMKLWEMASARLMGKKAEYVFQHSGYELWP